MSSDLIYHDIEKLFCNSKTIRDMSMDEYKRIMNDLIKYVNTIDLNKITYPILLFIINYDKTILQILNNRLLQNPTNYENIRVMIMLNNLYFFYKIIPYRDSEVFTRGLTDVNIYKKNDNYYILVLKDTFNTFTNKSKLILVSKENINYNVFSIYNYYDDDDDKEEDSKSVSVDSESKYNLKNLHRIYFGYPSNIIYKSTDKIIKYLDKHNFMRVDISDSHFQLFFSEYCKLCNIYTVYHMNINSVYIENEILHLKFIKDDTILNTINNTDLFIEPLVDVFQLAFNNLCDESLFDFRCSNSDTEEAEYPNWDTRKLGDSCPSSINNTDFGFYYLISKIIRFYSRRGDEILNRYTKSNLIKINAQKSKYYLSRNFIKSYASVLNSFIYDFSNYLNNIFKSRNLSFMGSQTKIRVFRGEQKEFLKIHEPNLKLGGLIKSRANQFISFSLDYSVAAKYCSEGGYGGLLFVLELDLSRDKYLPISSIKMDRFDKLAPLSFFPFEREILLPLGTIFTVSKIEYNLDNNFSGESKTCQLSHIVYISIASQNQLDNIDMAKWYSLDYYPTHITHY